MPEPTFGKSVDHRYGGDVCAGCFHTQSEEHPRKDVWTGGQFHAGFRRGKEDCLPGGSLATSSPTIARRTH